MIDDDRNKYETCPWCGKTGWLIFVLAKKPDEGIWAGWICDECVVKAHEREWGKKDERTGES